MPTTPNRTCFAPSVAGLAASACALALVAGCGKKAESPVAATRSPAPPVAPITIEAATPPVDTNAVVVTVYDKTMTRGEMDKQTERAMASPRLRNVPPQMAETMRARVKRDVMERFISHSILVHEADAKGVVATDADKKAMTDELTASLPKGLTLETALAASGLTLAEFDRQLSEDIKVRKVLDAQTTTVPAPTADEVRAFYTNSPASFQVEESAHARHILLKCEPTNTPAFKAERKQRAEGLREQLVKGGSFAELAKANSDCPSKDNGGDLGKFSRGQMVKAFEDAAFSQPTNAIGPIVETQFGYHIIQVIGRETARVQPFEEVEKNLSAHLWNQKKKTAVEAFVAKLRSDAPVKTTP
jgi:peptidyl-prolyl cis-trans isomerase C